MKLFQSKQPSRARAALIILLPVILIAGLLMSREMVSNAAGNPNQPYTLTFPEGNGNVTVVPSKNKVQFIVSLEGLSNGQYEIALEGDSGQGAIFGVGNAHLQAGELVDEVFVKPHAGSILLWAVHPERMVKQTSNARIVVYESSAERKAVASVALPK